VQFAPSIMDWGLAIANVLNPAALFFALGFAAVLLKTDLEIPHPLPKLFSLYLIIAIGYTGGTKLAASGLSGTVLLYIAASMFMAPRADHRLFCPAQISLRL
jgi:hypothetical protein